MSAEPDVTPVPFVDILQELRRVEGLSTAERVIWKNTLIDEPEKLAEIFARSIDQLEEAFGGGEQITASLNTRETRGGPKPPLTPTKAKKAKAAAPGPKTDLEKAHDIIYGVFEAGGVTVSGAPRLAADYVGYAVAPLRTKGDNAQFTGEGAPEGDPAQLYAIDLLLQSRDEDALPIVGEFKFGDDIDPLLQLLEALAYVALLATPSQFKRLRKYYVSPEEEGGGPRFDEADTPQFDIYLFVAGHRRNSASQQSALWDATPWVIDALLEEPAIAKHVRRIEGVRIPLGGDANVQTAGGAVLGKPVVWEQD